MEPKNDSETLRSIDKAVGEMRVALFGLDGNNGFVGATKLRLDAHTKRVSVIEKWMWTVTGAVGVISFLVAHHMITNVGK